MGERLRMSVPHGHRKTTTFVAGLRLEGMVAAMLLDGSMVASADVVEFCAASAV